MIPFSVISLGQFIAPDVADSVIQIYSNFYHSVTTKHQRRLTMYLIEDESFVSKNIENCKKHNIESSCVHLSLDQQEEIEKVYKSGSVFLLPVKENREALVKESLSYSLPFLGFKNYGFEDFIDQTCGMLIKETRESENILDFARLLQLLYFDPEARRFLKKGALQKYETQFSWNSSSMKPRRG